MLRVAGLARQHGRDVGSGVEVVHEDVGAVRGYAAVPEREHPVGVVGGEGRVDARDHPRFFEDPEDGSDHGAGRHDEACGDLLEPHPAGPSADVARVGDGPTGARQLAM